MTIATPVRVLENRDGIALCQSRHGNVEVSLKIIGPQEPGTWLISFLGVAQSVVSEDEAREIELDIEAFEAIILEAVEFDPQT